MLFSRGFFLPKVLLGASLPEVSGKRRLVDVHHRGIFGKLSILVQHYTALIVIIIMIRHVIAMSKMAATIGPTTNLNDNLSTCNQGARLLIE